MERKFLLCEQCGNLIEEKGEITNCCGMPMKEIIPNTTDASQEKHVPVISVEGNLVTVKVGEVLHPMSEEHYIKWIYLETNKGLKKVELTPNDEPIATFDILASELVLNAYAYCNLHSLWAKENN